MDYLLDYYHEWSLWDDYRSNYYVPVETRPLLHMAALAKGRQQGGTINVLVTAGIDVNMCDNEGKTDLQAFLGELDDSSDI